MARLRSWLDAGRIGRVRAIWAIQLSNPARRLPSWFDELPFGLFLEIEGEESAILEAEKLLGLESAEAEHAPYPELTLRHGTTRGGVVEARF